MKPFTLSDVYSKMKEAVRRWPLVDHKPNTFGVLTSFSDLDAANLGKTIRDKDRPYFFSKAWADEMHNPSKVKWAVPGVFIFEVGGTMRTDASNYITYQLQVASLDSMDSENEAWAKLTNDERAEHQIFEDTEDVLLKFLTHMRTIDLGVWSRPWEARFYDDNDSFTFDRWSGGSGKLLGNVATITVSIPCTAEEIVLRDDFENHQIPDKHDSQDNPESLPLLTGFNNEVIHDFNDNPLAPDD